MNEQFNSLKLADQPEVSTILGRRIRQTYESIKYKCRVGGKVRSVVFCSGIKIV